MEVTDKVKPILGTDPATLDEKGRVLVSKKKRDRLSDDFTLAIGSVGCLTAYPAWSWQRYLNEILSGAALNFGREEFSRLMLSTADDELKFDQQGRFVIPQKLRELAGLKKEVLLIGCGDRMEIWDVDEWKKYQEDTSAYGFTRRDQLSKAYIDMCGRIV